jgi:hypothetical protein
MLRRLPKRISLRGLLLLVALIAFGITCVHQSSQLRNARQRFENELAAWDAARRRLPEVVAAAEELLETESAALWISRTAARDRQIERLNYLAARAEASVATTMFGTRDGRDRRIEEARRIRKRVHELSAGGK